MNGTQPFAGPPPCEGLWRLSEGSARGKSHTAAKLPNQDSVFVVTDPSGRIVCAALCDGAGTASRSNEGAEETARSIAQRLCAAGELLHADGIRVDHVRSEIEAGIEALRTRISTEKGELHHFHCTLVTWLFTPAGSFIGQVGDSVALTTRFGLVRHAGSDQRDFFPEGQHTLHEPERGEYSNETHFVTEPDWKQHLRVTEVPPDMDAVILMSDGAMDVAMLRGEVFRGFLSNLIAKLLETPERLERNRVIRDWLGDPKTHRVTADDKTVFVAIRAERHGRDGVSVFLGQRRLQGEGSAQAISSVARARSFPPRKPRMTVTRTAPAAGRPAPEPAADPAVEEKAVAPVLQNSLWPARLVAASAAGLLVTVLSYPLYRYVHDGSPEAFPSMDVELPLQAVAAQERRAPEAEPDVAPEPAAQPLQRMVAHDVTVSASPRFSKGAALATVNVREGSPVTIARINVDSGLILDTKRAGACQKGLHLDPGEECQLHVRVKDNAAPGEYGIDLSFDTDDSASLSRRVVFDLPARSGRHR